MYCTDARKTAILEALKAWINQRPGLDPRDYGGGEDGWRAYRGESRSITRDLQDARELLNYVAARDSITADILLEAFSAYSGRLSIKDISARHKDGSITWVYSLDYCIGQYWPTEYRRAACAVLSAAIWVWAREHCLPVPDAGSDPAETTGWRDGPLYGGISAGSWLRRFGRRELGKRIADRWFN